DEADFGQLGRAGYIQQHVHRRLHNRAAQLNDKDLLELGKLDFNEQFVVLQTPGPRETGEEEAQAIFGEAGREGYLQQRVHRMLHAHVVHLSNLELVKLGEMSFSEQPFGLGRIAGSRPSRAGDCGESGRLDVGRKEVAENRGALGPGKKIGRG
ncbi:unnamed protein product, partial [Effrenium voratum]